MLNNKWFIGVLALLAGYFIFQRIMPLIFDGDDGFDAPIVLEDEDYYDEGDLLSSTGIETAEQGLQFDSAQHDLKRIDVADLFWNEAPSRDPFVPFGRLRKVDAEAVKNKVAGGSTTIAPRDSWRPLVSAIVNSSQHQYAVIDGEIRRVGDRFNGHRLVAVAQNSVRLTNLGNNESQEVMVKP